MGCLQCTYLEDRSCIEGMIFYEDKDFLGFVSDISVNPGHSVLLPKRHINFFNFGKDETKKFGELVIATSRSLREYYLVSGVKDISLACWGEKHAYCHIIPLYRDDRLPSVLEKQYRNIGGAMPRDLANSLREKLKPYID